MRLKIYQSKKLKWCICRQLALVVLVFLMPGYLSASPSALTFNTTETRINPAWYVWGSQAMIRLYEAEKNEAWLVYAKENVNRLDIANRNSTTLGYCFFPGFNGQNRSTEMEIVDQAWMQRLQAMRSKFNNRS
ncbi:hypothetical protein ACJVDH_08060 [Pedobacter sp. AW1-32]|uniref:hypothetical protein n=1 Tax=Pedobacter sp. AW1-32 TaxID=3383026 RepID=UPI003FEE5062